MKTIQLTDKQVARLKKLLNSRIKRRHWLTANLRRTPAIIDGERESFEAECKKNADLIKEYLGILENL